MSEKTQNQLKREIRKTRKSRNSQSANSYQGRQDENFNKCVLPNLQKEQSANNKTIFDQNSFSAAARPKT